MTHIASLPDHLLIAIVARCDEPARDNSTCVSRRFLTCTSLARKDVYLSAAAGRSTPEVLPTVTQLADHGCKKPNFRNILNAAAHWALPRHLPSPVGVATAPGAEAMHLRAFYEKAAAWQLQPPPAIPCPALPYDGDYSGEMVNGVPQGFGVLTTDQVQAMGFWKPREGGGGSHLHGRGVQAWMDGELYEGQYALGEFHGYGVQTRPDGSRYAGEFDGGLPHGDGVEISAVGQRWEGHWAEGEPQDSASTRAVVA